MPQRKLLEPTSLRRSPRLLNQSKLSPSTPKPIYPKNGSSSSNSTKSSKSLKKSDSGYIVSKNIKKSADGSSNSVKNSNLLKKLNNGSKKSANGSSNSSKNCIILKRLDNGSKNLRKSANGSSNSSKNSIILKKLNNGSKNIRKSANGSSNSSKNSNILKRLDNGLNNLRKSSNGSRKKGRLSEVVDCPRRSSRFCNEVNSSIELHTSSNSNKELNLLRNDDFVDCPVTPIGVGEKKSMFDTDTSDSCGGILLNFDRRITRSCSRLANAKTPIIVREKKSMLVNDTDTSDSCGGILVNSDRRITRSCSRLAKAKTQIGIWEKKSMLVNDTDTSDSCGGILVNSDRRITRSCSRLAKAKVEAEKVTERIVKGRNLFEDKVDGSKGREVQSSAKLNKGKEKRGKVEVRKVEENKKSELKGKKVRSVSSRSSLKLVSCSKGKEKRGGDCKGVKGSSERRLDSVSHCVAGGGQQGRQNKLTDCDNKVRKTGDSCKEVVEVLEGRITRSASKKVGGQIKPHCHIMEGRVTRSASKQVLRKSEKNISDIDVKGKGIRDCVSGDIDKLEIDSIDPSPLCKLPGKVERNEQDVTMHMKVTGVKRKRKQEELQERTNKGWTKEQELKLHKAYFTAKPSPHFWKRVAKLVPGKSAQECFDKVHSDNQTPVCSKPSLRAKKKSPLSGIELFDSAKKKGKKIIKAKRKSHVGRKTVRHLLQKYCHVNQDSGTDLFSILEPSANPSVEGYNLTPEQLMRSPDLSSKSRGRYSSGHKKCLSRLSDTSESFLTSPPVLKKVKNIVLHEKYIDQLHTREHKRKLSFSRYMKSAQNQKAGEENSIHVKDIIKNAKEALFSEAKDAINTYRHSQANIMEGISDADEFFSSDDEDSEVVV